MSYWHKPEMWRDEDVPSEHWDDFMKGQKEMSNKKDNGEFPLTLKCGIDEPSPPMWKEKKMTNEKLLEVISLYENIVPQKIDVLVNENYHSEASKLYHILEMLPKMREFVAEGRREKTMRWLGFIQGCLWMNGFPLDELKRHNMPTSSQN